LDNLQPGSPAVISQRHLPAIRNSQATGKNPRAGHLQTRPIHQRYNACETRSNRCRNSGRKPQRRGKPQKLGAIRICNQGKRVQSFRIIRIVIWVLLWSLNERVSRQTATKNTLPMRQSKESAVLDSRKASALRYNQWIPYKTPRTQMNR